ncbi:MAG: arginine--tRNA ligase [Bacteroidales bacterium]
MTIEQVILRQITSCVEQVYGTLSAPLQLQKTRKEFTGDFTLVTFPLTKISRKSPDATAQELGEQLKQQLPNIHAFNVIKGFLNLEFTKAFWRAQFEQIYQEPDFGFHPPLSSSKTMMVEYSSPNTNKPLHLGHIRNNLLGNSVARILAANGHKVIKVNLVNDRGIHICKSMLAWQKWGNGATPQSSGKKGDHLVGDYYVKFDQHYKIEIKELQAKGLAEEEAKRKAPLMIEAQNMLLRWEMNDAEVVQLWEMMNGWVYEGFASTYEKLGVDFDKTYYESKTYLLGKQIVEQGLAQGVFYKKDDGSVWVDLTDDGLDHKLLLRADGTSVYITQDLGTAQERFAQHRLDEHIYVVGNEQNYHFQVLKLVLKKLGYAWAQDIFHLSYGMVELPEGKMKSREGTVVDADDLMQNMVDTARETSLELGKLADMPHTEQELLFNTIGLGALKYFILKVDPQKTMLFDPKESIDFNGNTGPFLQYTHARICSILNKANALNLVPKVQGEVGDREVELIKKVVDFPQVIMQAGSELSPALIANYIYELAKDFNQYYHNVSILKEENQSLLLQRLALIKIVSSTLNKGASLLGIDLPEKM